MANVDQFLRSLGDSGLLSGDDLIAVEKEVSTEERSRDAQKFAQKLVKQGKLTLFQASHVYQGRSRGLVFGEYTVLDRIGAGGMGQVFKAQHRRMKRTVALKVIAAASTKTADAAKRFQREVEAAARLTHPNIVTAYDAGEQAGVNYLVMEFVEGGDLASLIKNRGTIPVGEALDYIIQAARGLAYAHSQGVIHRDIKPANLLLDKHGVVKILDMGLARLDGVEQGPDNGLTQTGAVMGTVDYMAPEQAMNTRRADARSDIYSLGCTLYRLLTSKNMFDGDTVVEKIIAHREQAIPAVSEVRSDVPVAVETLFRRLVAKRPDDRPATMAEALAELEQVRQGLSAVIAPLVAARPGSESKTAVGISDTLLPPPIALAPRSAAARSEPPPLKAKRPMNIPLLATVGGGLLLAIVGGWWATRGGSASDGGASSAASLPVAKLDTAPVVVSTNAAPPSMATATSTPPPSTPVKSTLPVSTPPKASPPSTAPTTVAVASKTSSSPSNTPSTTATSAKPQFGGWVSLFDGSSFTGWTGQRNLFGIEQMPEGSSIVSLGGRGELWTEKQYSDFEVALSFRVDTGANNGLGLRYSGSGVASVNGLEVQIIDDVNAPKLPYHMTGAIFRYTEAQSGQLKRKPEWNELLVRCVGDQVTVTLNDRIVNQTDLAVLRQKDPNSPGLNRSAGHLCLCANLGRTEFRNLRIRERVGAPTTAPVLTTSAPTSDLSTWQGLLGYWKYQQGVLSGSTLELAARNNTFYCSPRDYGDFELRCQVKVRGGNSGINFRSTWADERQLSLKGPQADFGAGYWGSLYGEATGGGMMRQADMAAVARVLRSGDFNDVFVSCIGKRVKITINGLTTVDGEFAEIKDRGRIGFQIHSGKDTDVEFRQVELRELDGRNSTPAANATSTTSNENAGTTPSLPDDPPVKRLPPLPEGDTLAKATKVVAETYQAELTAAKTTEAKAALADKVLGQVQATLNDLPGQYALLQFALDLAIEMGDMRRMEWSIQRLANSFEVDATEKMFEACQAASKKPHRPHEYKMLADAIGEQADDSAERDDFTAALRWNEVARAASTGAKDATLSRQIADRTKEWTDLQKQVEAAEQAARTLKDSPDDFAANLTLGRDLAFRRREWSQAWPYLIKGSDKQLADLASKGITASTIDEQIATGDEWWSASEKATAKRKGELQRGARYWYTLALPQLSGVNKTRIDKRLAEAANDALRDSKYLKLFNGKNLAGWQTGDNSMSRWQVQNGAITCSPGGFTRLVTTSAYENFQFRAEVLVNNGGNGGLHFRIPSGNGLKNGYEAAINCTHAGDKKRTGSIYLLDGNQMLYINPTPLIPPSTWFRMEVIVRDNRIKVLVNNRLVSDVIDPSRRYMKGHLALEHNGNPTVIFYRNLEVKELPAGG